MELYFKQLRSFNLMRKREGSEAATQTFLELLLEAEEQLYIRVPETLLYGYAEDPVLIFTGSKGVKTLYGATPQHLSDFVTICSHDQNPSFRTPLCVSRQEDTTVVMDTLAVASVWHKCTTNGKKLILQRYVLSSGGHQIIAHAKWKAGKTSAVTFCNKSLHFDQNSFLKYYGTVAPEERFLTSPANSVIISNCPNLNQISEMMDVMSYHLRSKFKDSSYSEVEEFVMEFVQDTDLNWYVIRLLSYDLDRKPKTINKAMLQRKRPNHMSSFSINPSPKRPRIVKREPFPFKPPTFPVSPFELKQAIKIFSMTKRMRSSFVSNQYKKSFTNKSLNTSVVLSRIHLDDPSDTPSMKRDQMPPIFSFPTPKTPHVHKFLSTSYTEDDGLALLKCPVEERVGIIKEHIQRQNNSLYTRIHYQGELPEKRVMKEVYKKAVDRVVNEMEFLQSKARLARETLNLLKLKERNTK